MGASMWQKVAKVSDFDVAGAQRVQTSSADIAVFKKGGRFYAISNICPHKGASLVEGYVEGNVVTCPWHAWQFDISSGVCQNVPAMTQKCFAVKIHEEDILLDL